MTGQTPEQIRRERDLLLLSQSALLAKIKQIKRVSKSRLRRLKSPMSSKRRATILAAIEVFDEKAQTYGRSRDQGSQLRCNADFQEYDTAKAALIKIVAP